MATEELLQAGIAAARAGDINKASKLLIQVVQKDPNSESGWFWLGLCREVPKHREYCFRRVLAINPQNVDARHQIEFLHRSAINSQEVQTLTPANDAPRGSAPQFIEPLKNSSSKEQKTNEPPPAKKTVHPKPGKKGGNRFIWVILGLVTFACIAAAGIFVLARMINSANTPVIVNQPPTSIPTTAVATSIPNYQPEFQATACDFQIPEQSWVTCGFVVVPENRSGDLTDTIRIAVAVFHSTSNTPKPDPILYLQGGPGDKAITWSVGAFESVIAPLLVERDFVVFDPRGVGYSEPALKCDEFSTTYLHDLEGKIPSDQRASYYEGALLGCKNNLVKQGANLSTYTSAATAWDARDVLVALGYQQANLYGISYGTRVAQLMMRDHPEVVRSAILDSVVPIETQLLSQSTVGPDYALRTLFDDCKADTDCSSAYPDLEATYNEVLNRLNAQPVNLTVSINQNRKLEQVIDGSIFRNTIIWTLRMPQTIGLAPQLIYRTRDGDNTTLMLSLAFPILAFDSISMGTYISVNCHDQVFAMSLEKLDQTIYDMCELWGANPILPGENDPVNSEIPALIFAGRYDAVTPPSFAHQLAEHLAHSYIAEIPDQGHAPSTTGISDCPTKLISAFLQDPNLAPDLTCIKETQPIKFIVPHDANTPITLEPATIEQYQINTRIPAGWSKADFGFYNRNGFWGDITQIGVQRAPIPESEWVTWLATNFSGKQGLDQPAVQSNQRSANGLTWSLYKTSLQGYPVDIAFAQSNKQTLMILLFSYKDEHDALYNNVFLPIIDSTIPSR
jgi:pimeloyl-ACP methyl ester carboxylesterase